MTYTLGNKYAKNICKRTVLLQLIIKNVVTCFFWNTVYILQHCGMYFHYNVTKIVECTISSEQNVSKTLNFAG